MVHGAYVVANAIAGLATWVAKTLVKMANFLVTVAIKTAVFTGGLVLDMAGHAINGCWFVTVTSAHGAHTLTTTFSRLACYFIIQPAYHLTIFAAHGLVWTLKCVLSIAWCAITIPFRVSAFAMNGAMCALSGFARRTTLLVSKVTICWLEYVEGLGDGPLGIAGALLTVFFGLSGITAYIAVKGLVLAWQLGAIVVRTVMRDASFPGFIRLQVFVVYVFLYINWVMVCAVLSRAWNIVTNPVEAIRSAMAMVTGGANAIISPVVAMTWRGMKQLIKLTRKALDTCAASVNTSWAKRGINVTRSRPAKILKWLRKKTTAIRELAVHTFIHTFRDTGTGVKW